MRVFVDTNVFVYLFDSGEPEKQRRAREVVADLARRKALILSTQVLSELYVVLTRKLSPPMQPAQAQRVLADLAAFPTVAIDAALVQNAAELSSAEQMAYWDALIIVSAAEGGAGTVFSEDLQAGRSYRGVTVEDPLAPSASTP